MHPSLALWLLLLLPALLYVAVAVQWHSRGAYPVTGDEPHFLIIAESLLRDGDLWVANNYAQATPVTDALGSDWSADDVSKHSRGFSLHSAGLGLLLMPAYAAGGAAGAKYFLALTLGLVVSWLFYAIARDTGLTRGWACAFALTAALNLPFLAGANQIFADLPGGIVILHAAWLVVRGLRRRDFSTRALVLIGMDCGALPWLHLRLGAAALILLAFAVWGVLSTVPRERIARAALPLLTAAPFYLLLALFYFIAFQRVFGPFSANDLSNDPKLVLMIFAGLHLDSVQGIFLQAPFFFLGLVGIVPFARANRAGALCVVLVYLVALAPGAMSFNWYGGTGLAGRYAWDGIGLWILPMASAFGLVLAQRGGAWLLGGLCAASLGLQLLFARVWLESGFLSNRGVGMPEMAQADLYTLVFGLRLFEHALLPAFGNFDEYLTHRSNLFWALGCVLLVALGYAVLASKRRLTGALAAVFGAACVLLVLFTVPRTVPLVWTGAQLKSHVGTVNGSERVARAGEDGILAATPALPLYRDVTYRLRIRYRTGDKAAGRYFVVVDGGTRVASDRLPLTHGRAETLTLDTPPSNGAGTPSARTIEFWTYYNGRGALTVEELVVEARWEEGPMAESR
jgi:hypothetical protein